MNKINHKKILETGKYKKISLNGINKKLAVELYTFMLKLRLCEEAIEKEYHPADECVALFIFVQERKRFPLL